MTRQAEVRERGRRIGTAELVDAIDGHTQETFPHIAYIELDDGYKESDVAITPEEARLIHGDIHQIDYIEVTVSTVRPLCVAVVPK